MKLIIDIPEECLKNISNAFELGEDITKRTIDIILDSITKSTPIPDNTTNGDVIKALFPSIKIRWISQSHIGVTFRDNQDYITQLELDWWNAPYQKVR